MPEPTAQPTGAPVIPGYRLEGVLGRGATGIVYRARQISVDRVVALKVLHQELAGATHAARRLQREARTTARLAHPNIISAIDMGEVDGLWWYAMELVDGMSLAERLRERRLTEREALRMFIPLVDALQHAFERGVVHRDIKPANILVARDGRALLVDLGLAFTEDDPLLTKPGGTLGTPHYISPEQARDPSGADAQSDLWSLGATLYHAVCGRPPFAGESVAEILSEVLYAKIADPTLFAPELSSGFVLVLRKCLARDKVKRYATPAELLADLERVRERRAPKVRRRGLEPLAHRARALRRSGVIAAAALLGAVGIAWATLAWRDEPGLAADSDVASPSDDPLEVIARRGEADPKELTSALLELDRIGAQAATSTDVSARLEVLRARLARNLETQVWRFKRDAETRFQSLIAQREFDAAEKYAASGLRDELSERVGREPLPARTAVEIEQLSTAFSARAKEARSTAERAFASAVDQHYTTRVLPRVDELEARGAWRSARALLTVESADWLVAAQIPSSGLSSEAIEKGLALLRAKIDRRREALDAAWTEVDASLRQWVTARTGALAADLEARTLTRAADALAAQWSTELSDRKLSIEEMPLGLLHLAHEELATGTQRLAELERRLAAEDARRGFAELEEETAARWRDRRYAEIARVFDELMAEPWREPVRAQMELRVREARLLQELLEKAAAGARARDGQLVDLRTGTIVLSGKLAAGADPLTKGVRLALGGGSTRTLELVPDASDDVSGTVLLAPEGIELLAGLSAESTVLAAPRDRLLRALFRFRDVQPAEDAARAAQAVLNSGPLPRQDALVTDLEARVAASLRTTSSVAGERASRARDKLYLLRREGISNGNRETLRRRAEDLIANYGDVLSSDDMSELRRLRDDLYANLQPSTREEIEAAFRPTALDLVGPDRVRLRYDFDRVSAGAFEAGTWLPDQRGWSALRAARSDADMLAQAAPTLQLGEPLRPKSDVVSVRWRMEQPADSPADLLVVSCVGYHALLVGARDGRPARCLIESGDLAEAVARARDGAGREFAGIAAGRAFELNMAVNHGRGTVLVELDGQRIAFGQRPTPRGELPIVSVRSFEPVRVVRATIEASRR